MAPVTNARVIFNAVPEGYPEPGKTTVYDTSKTIDLDTVPLNGGFLIKTLALSVDPYMRGKMRHPEKKSYSPPYALGEPLFGHGVGVVLRSELDSVKAGDHVYAILKHEEYQVYEASSPFRVLDSGLKLPWSAYLGPAGMPGQTAFFAWKEYSQAKKGEVVFVSTGAGSVGSLVIQLAKQDGLKVIASAGSDEKVEFMKELGADVAFNYKTTDTREILEKEGPIDVYWDNVGGDTLDAALEGAALGARFIECGMISGYNTGGATVKNLALVIGKSITIHGFIVGRLAHRYEAEFYDVVPAKIAKGEIKYREQLFEGLQSVGDAMLAVQNGTSTAKAVVVVAHE